MGVDDLITLTNIHSNECQNLSFYRFFIIGELFFRMRQNAGLILSERLQILHILPDMRQQTEC